MFDRFTDRARKVMGFSRMEAVALGSGCIDTFHVLIALAKETGGIAGKVLRLLGAPAASLRARARNLLPVEAPSSGLQLPFTPGAKDLLKHALEESSRLTHSYIGTEHLLLGLLRGSPDDAAVCLLRGMGLDGETIRREVEELLGIAIDAKPRRRPKSKTPALDAFTSDLCAAAAEGQLEPVAPREDLLTALLAILGRRHGSSACLIGPAGSGRSALIDSLAARIAAGKVPASLSELRLARLDALLIVAGTRHRGVLEERLGALVAESRRRGHVVLVLDDLDVLLESTGQEWSERLERWLRTALRDGHLRCLLRATAEGFARLQRRDPELAGLLRPVPVGPPTRAELRAILQARRDGLEAHHRLCIPDPVLDVALRLGGSEQAASPLPADVLELLDEAAARVSLARWAGQAPEPAEWAELRARIQRLDAQKLTAVSDQEFEAAAALRDQADRARAKLDTQRVRWQAEHAGLALTPADVELVWAERARGRRGVWSPRPPRPLAAPPQDSTEFERLQVASLLASDPQPTLSGRALVLLPSGKRGDTLLQRVCRPVLAEHELQVERAESVYRPGTSLTGLSRSLRAAELVIADLSGRDPGVLFAVGLALGLGRCPLLLAEDPADLPPDLRNLKYLRYVEDTLELFRGELARAVGERLTTLRGRRDSA